MFLLHILTLLKFDRFINFIYVRLKKNMQLLKTSYFISKLIVTINNNIYIFFINNLKVLVF
jgi:hypothetical protein